MSDAQQLINAAIDQLDRRWPEGTDGVAAAVLLDDGQIITSVGFDNINAAANLCAETGAICQAFTLNVAVAVSVCVARANGQLKILAPCGICQERLAVWGPDVQIVVADGPAPIWAVHTLAELQPHYWATQYTSDGGWPSTAQHSA